MLFNNKSKKESKDTEERDPNVYYNIAMDGLKSLGLTEEEITANNYEFIYMNRLFVERLYEKPRFVPKNGEGIFSDFNPNGGVEDLGPFFLTDSMFWEVLFYSPDHHVDFPRPRHPLERFRIPKDYNYFKGDFNDFRPEVGWRKNEVARYYEQCKALGFKPKWDDFIFIYSGFPAGFEHLDNTHISYNREQLQKIYKWSVYNNSVYYTERSRNVFHYDYDRIGVPEHMIEDYINGGTEFKNYFDKALEIGEDTTRHLNKEMGDV